MLLNALQVAALKNLGLYIRRAKLKRDEGKGTVQHKFFITDSHTAEKARPLARSYYNLHITMRTGHELRRAVISACVWVAKRDMRAQINPKSLPPATVQ